MLYSAHWLSKRWWCAGSG